MTSDIRVLIVEDNAADRELIEVRLAEVRSDRFSTAQAEVPTTAVELAGGERRH